MDGYTGCAVAIDPNSGGVLGLVSAPDYEPNAFINGLEDWHMSYFLNSKSKPLLNRALQCHYPPGSIFKMVTLLAGLENSIITTKDAVNCKGFIEMGKYNQKFRCWKETGHGEIRLTEALANSCDIYFYELGLKLGPAKINEWSKKYMLGEKTGIDLPFEVKGLIPDKAWKKSRLNQMWYDGDTVNMSIGQGYMLVTPVQIAQYVAALANGGTIFQTYVLKKIMDANSAVVTENLPHIRSQLSINPANMKVVKAGMLSAVRYGTARAAFLPELSVAGKTGTAQNPHGKDHAWFVCFAPYDKPKVAIVVMVEHGGGGGEVAAPIAGRILSDMFYSGFFD
jgi:penicillin-binding protein 2